MDSHEIVDDLRIALSLSYFISMCLGHPNCSVNLEQWATEVRHRGKCFSRFRAVARQQTCRLSVAGRGLRWRFFYMLEVLDVGGSGWSWFCMFEVLDVLVPL